MTIKTSITPQKESSRREIIVNIVDITQDLFVREKLDDDRVWYWAIRFENDPDSIKAIEITQHSGLTDGRHRIAGALLAGKSQIKAYIFAVKNRAEQITRAFLSNIAPDSPKPPTKADAIMTIKQMLNEGCARKDVVALMERMFPRNAAIELYNEARHGIYRDKLRDAKRAVLDDGMTVATASVKFDVDPEKLREEMGGKKKKSSKLNPGDFNRNLSSHYRSLGQKIRGIFSKVEEGYMEGDMSKEDALNVYDYAIHSTKQRLQDLMDKKERLNKK